jgi:hypothetical protein
MKRSVRRVEERGRQRGQCSTRSAMTISLTSWRLVNAKGSALDSHGSGEITHSLESGEGG